MRINSINNSFHKVLVTKKINKANTISGNTSTPICQNCYYMPIISFKAKKSDMSLIKQISESLETNQLPELTEPTNLSLPVGVGITDKNFDETRYKDALENKKFELTKEFINKTRSLYQNPNSTNEEKLKAIQTACTFIKERDYKYQKTSMLGDYLNSLNLAAETNHTVFSDRNLNKIFDESQKYWEKEYLPKLMDSEKKKLQYLEMFYQKRPDLKKSKTFNDLSYQDQYFVAKYFEINDFKCFDDDPMLRILSNVAIEEKQNVLNEIRQKISLDVEIFNDVLANIPLMIKDETGITFLKEVTITGKNDENTTNLLEFLLKELEKEDLANQPIQAQKEYFATLDSEKLTQAIEGVKQKWFAKNIPLKTEKEVTYQAYKNDIHVKNNNELKKINAQLEQINIKLDKISLSLAEFISNLDGVYAKFPNPAEDCAEIYRRTGIQLEAMNAATKNLTNEEDQKLLKAFRTEGIEYLDVMLKNTKDNAVKTLINDLKKIIKTTEKPNAILSRLEGYATMAVMGGFLHGSGTSAAATSHAVNTLANSDLTDVSGAKSTVTGGGLSALISPQALALVAITAGLYGITNANKVHKQFTDIYINVDL